MLTTARDATAANAGVVSFGGFLLRLSVPDHGRIGRTTHSDVHYGRGESNVAVALAQMGLRARFVTRLPDHAVAKAGLAMTLELGIDTTQVTLGGDRLSIYFLES